jgi:hypothetical protein
LQQQVRFEGGVHPGHPRPEARQVAGAGGALGFGQADVDHGAGVADLDQRRAVGDLAGVDQGGDRVEGAGVGLLGGVDLDERGLPARAAEAGEGEQHRE